MLIELGDRGDELLSGSLRRGESYSIKTSTDLQSLMLAMVSLYYTLLCSGLGAMPESLTSFRVILGQRL